MEQPTYIQALDEYFCANYSDYVKISAIEGYVMPEVLYVARDGNIARRDSSCMRLCNQENREELLKRFKEGLADTDFTFSFRFPKLKERIKRFFSRREKTFAKLLPETLAHCGESVQSAGEKLSIEPRFWEKLAKGSLIPEKNTIFALALVCHMQQDDVFALLESCNLSLKHDNVRDVVLEYLIVRKIGNPEMRNACLKEYKIDSLPIRA